MTELMEQNKTLEPGELKGSVSVTSNKEIYITTYVEKYVIYSRLEIDKNYQLTILKINNDNINKQTTFDNVTEAQLFIINFLKKKLIFLEDSSFLALTVAINKSWLEPSEAKKKVEEIHNACTQ
jgi:hypothetical protein